MFMKKIISVLILLSLALSLGVVPSSAASTPPGIGRATLNCRYTRSCNPRDVLPGGIAAPAVGSYPAFSPLPAGITKIPCGRSFSVTLLYPHGYQVVSLRGALCCPDFPLPASAGSDRAGLPRKGNKIRRIPAPRLRFPDISREYPGLPPWYSRPCRARAPGLCRDAFPPGGRVLPEAAAIRRRPRLPPFPCRRIRRCLRRIPRSLSAYSVRTHRMPRTESFLQILDKVVFLLCPSAVLRGGGPEEYTGRWQITRIRSTYTTTARLSDCSVRGMKNVSMRFSAAITNRSAPMPRASCRRYAPRNSSRTP